MTVSSRPVRRTNRERRFDLRTTALFFLFVAILLCGTAALVRAAAHMVESRPLWIGSLAVVGVAAACLGRSRWRRVSAARYARRAAEVLEEAAERASESLEGTKTPTPATTVAAPVVPAVAGDGFVAEPTLVLEPEDATTVVLDAPAAYVDYTELDADAFEQAVADLCARDACQEVEVVGGACDLGADVLAVAPDGRRLVIQCKRYGEDNKVGSQDLQRFGGTCFTVHEADVAALVTTSDFTAPALEYAQQCGIVCVNGAELQAWCDGTGPSPWDLVVVEA
ncbi:restriction endonuclease [Streptomyces sp. Je 1-369]|uniref:restriction endonuclease n=1 Tax=Streptomyces sp. Je 1-369 TaxID=2966192 RepID=UPI002285662D|nr:restriction endonuclease [Streptomyces sp. Je 1-369]WAL93743.1 restriction endonuclease [Streptomyces sp. Je 1-369]